VFVAGSNVCTNTNCNGSLVIPLQAAHSALTLHELSQALNTFVCCALSVMAKTPVLANRPLGIAQESPRRERPVNRVATPGVQLVYILAASATPPPVWGN
jgi:hypothetical protein